ncbi:MAG: hypothetical protein PHP73_06335 [Candidatus Omnitrophica bacterium]|nr:hypothetical protein [Candidatus Omnitrophota bacterium]
MPCLNTKLAAKGITFLGLFLFFCLLLTNAFAANYKPAAGTITPVSGTSNPYQPVNFTTTYSDANGWQDIKSANLLINTSANGANCFYGYYNRSINKLYLRNNANTAWLGGFAPRSARIIENSYVKLDCSKTTISGSGNTLTVKWAVTFKAASIGAKKAYLSVKDNANASSGWVQKGTWNITVSNKPPVIARILPKDNSVFLAGAAINIKAYAFGPDHDPLQYQFSIGGTVKQAWSSSNTYIWQTSPADKGAVSITCEVKDSNSNLTSKTISIRIIDPTAQEVLKRVADNYAKISDFSANMTLSSTLNAKPFGATDYCRYYFKAPNKEKTETFNDAARKVKNDIIIISGTNMHLINPIANIKQTVDLLADAGISSTEFSQLDLHYNQTLFLSKNTVSRNDLNTDFNNMIIALDASPNEKNNIYDKLGILIDYKKGLITKFSIYRINQANILELVQETAAVGFRKLPNGAWLPVKMTKNPNLTSGKLISTLIYNNLKINQNLSDDIFDPNRQ